VSADTPVQPALPSIIGGKYRPTRLIARGGMGAVYEVVHANTGEHLALKLMLARSLLAPELVERFKREARIQSSVKSEHVVRVVDADVAPELEGAPFLVMELLAGKDFERICQERRPTPEEAVDWLAQVGRALDRAHREGIVHRDLKPENLFLSEREDQPPIVKVLDFGVAKMTSGTTEGNSTATGQILGTPRYMAPEQAAGAKQITPAADRCALGLIAFRLLCGRHYFEGDNWVSLLRDVTRGASKAPSEMGHDLGPAFDVWFAKACALDPAERFESCTEQVEALGKALADASVLARWKRAAWRARRAAGWTALAMGCAAGVMFAVIGRQQDRPAVAAPAEGHRSEPARPGPLPDPAGPPGEVSPAAATAAPERPAAGARTAAGPDRPRKRRIAKTPRPPSARTPDTIWEEP
jgi:tRNA A-37 threonylcarbamoyl transferase component Bud32